jgi:hypothetical protein
MLNLGEKVGHIRVTAREILDRGASNIIIGL